MKFGVAKEVLENERRVALVPESVARLKSKGAEFGVETAAGQAAGFSDAEYEAAGAQIVASGDALRAQSDVIVQINPPRDAEIGATREGAAHISLLFPLTNTELVTRMTERSLTAIALDRIPRTTLAQAMDVLSSQSTVAGYRAVMLASYFLPKFFPLLMTAAGRIDPARVMILGAGVAGLQAIGIARRLGAVVEAYDVRAVVKEQVESLGATFIDIGVATDAETAGGYAKEVGEDVQAKANEVIGKHLEHTDVCITTALIPGRPAPRLVTNEMLSHMRPGSLMIDLAAEQGGNVEASVAGETVTVDGVTVMGPKNLPSDVPFNASQMFSRNVEKLILYMLKDGDLTYDFEKEIVAGCVVTHEGKIVDSQVAELLAS